MNRLWPIVRREFLERVRSKAFLIATILGPVLMGLLTVGPALLMGRAGKPQRVALLDETGRLAPAVRAVLAGHELSDGQPRFVLEEAAKGASAEAQLKARVLEGALDGYLKLPEDAMTRSAVEYYGKTVSNMIDLRLMEGAASTAVTAERLASLGVDRSRAAELTKGVDLKPVRVSKTGEREDRGAGFILSFMLVMMLYTTVLMWGQAILTSVVEEKTSRVVEVIVSAVRPHHLLAGKLLGVGAAGLAQFAAWALTLLLISFFGASSMGGKLPEIAPLTLVFFLVFFLLGYLMYAALFAAVGACVNTTQEAQSLAFPVFMPLILAVMLAPMVMQSPDSTTSTVLSLVPLLSPVLMFLRMNVLTPPAWQIALSVALCLATIAAILFVAGRVYRVGILMYGKRPTFPEIMRWVGRS